MSPGLASRLPLLCARQLHQRHASIAANAAATRTRLLQPLLILPLILSAGFASARPSKPKSAAAAASASSSTLPPLYTPDFDMAWRCSGDSNRELVDNLRKAGIIESDRVQQAMIAVDRGLFCPRDQHGKIVPPAAYQDSPQYLGFGATISAPHMHVRCSAIAATLLCCVGLPVADRCSPFVCLCLCPIQAMALELLADHLTPGKVALDVGSGSGYLVAAMAEMIAPTKTKGAAAAATKEAGAGAGAAAASSSADAAAPKAVADAESKGAEAASAASAPAAPSSSSSSAPTPVVYGIEHIQDLVSLSLRNLRDWDKNFAARISVAKGDGRLGVPGRSFDAIHVGAAAAGIPAPLIEQLRPGGRMVIPVGPESGDQYLEVLDKSASGAISKRRVTGVRYVPLTSEAHQLKSV